MGVDKKQATKIVEGIQRAARVERARRATRGLEWALDALAVASPAELAEDWHKVRAIYDQYPSAHRDLARAHPAPYTEYAHRIESPDPAVAGKPIALGRMHVEGVQVLHNNKRVIWESSRDHMATTCLISLIEWRLGKNNDLRIKAICESREPAKKRVMKLRNRIDASPVLRDVFPELRPDKALPWGQMSFYLERHKFDSHEPSVEGCGVLGSATGGRTDIFAFDDVVGKRNAITNPSNKQQVKTSFFSDWYGQGIEAVIWYLCNYWTGDDLSQDLVRRSQRGGAVAEPLPSGGEVTYGEEWVYLRHAVDPKTNRSPWPERWSELSMRTARSSMPAADYARGWLCREPTREENDFDDAWWKFMPTPDRERFAMVISMVDTATTHNEGSAWTSMATVGVLEVPETEENPIGLHVHFIEYKRWKLKLSIRVKRIIRQIVRHDSDAVGVENASDGPDVIDMLTDLLQMDIDAVPAIQAKRERLNRHQPLFRHGLVTFAPHLDPEVIAEIGDETRPDPISEIMGRVGTMDCADVTEMCLRKVREEFAFPLHLMPDHDEGDDEEAVASVLGDVAAKPDPVDPSADSSHDKSNGDEVPWWEAGDRPATRPGTVPPRNRDDGPRRARRSRGGFRTE